MFYNNFGKCGPIFKILYLYATEPNCTMYRVTMLKLHLQCVAIPCEIRKFKIVTEFLR